MRKDITTTLAVLALAAAVAVSPKPAAAYVRDTVKEGAWTASEGVANDGKRMCGMYVHDAAGVKWAYFKYFLGDPGLTMQVFKTGWKIPEGTPVKVALAFDNKAFSEGTGGGRPSAADSKISLVQIYINKPDLIEQFFWEFGEADTMTIGFPDGNEAPWQAEMVGSRVIGNAFRQCIARITNGRLPWGTTPQATQPYSRQPEAGAQPFNRDKLPTPTPDRGV